MDTTALLTFQATLHSPSFSSSLLSLVSLQSIKQRNEHGQLLINDGAGARTSSTRMHVWLAVLRTAVLAGQNMLLGLARLAT